MIRQKGLNMEIELVAVNSTPVFAVQGTDPHWSRVYGATFDKKGMRWLFPAFPPFINNVLQDFANVHADIPLNKEASTWVEKVGTIESWKAVAEGLDLPTTSYEHQVTGLSELLYNYRWILNWEMGTGKSKVVIDALNHLKTTALVLCPLIAVDNWAEEIRLHSGGELTTLVLQGASRAKKMKLIQSYEDQDVIITTFDTARIYGTPQMLPKALKVFQKKRLPPNPGIKKVLRTINDSETQVRFAHEWVGGRKLKEIRAEAAELIQGKRQWLVQLPYETIVADESHRIKRIQSGATKIALQLSQKASRRYELSGTLAQGDPRDLYPQLKFLAPYLIPENWMDFCSMYLTYSPRNDKIVTGYKNIHILNARVEEVSSVKKLIECVDLPERQFETVYFNLSAAQRRDYNGVVGTNTIECADRDPVEIANGAIKVSKLLQLCSGFVYVPDETDICDTCPTVMHCVEQNVQPGTPRCTNPKASAVEARVSLRYPDNPKLDTVSELLKDMLLGSKVIIWACFGQELDDIEEMLVRNKWGYVRVDGSTTKHIKKLAAKFDTDPDCRVYLAQISTGIAITLNAATYTIYYSRDWSLENRQQSLFRNFRIGQSKKTVVYDVCARGSLELQQLNALRCKADISKLLTDRVDCALCNQYRVCLAEDITPWTTACVLSTGAEKKIARARMI